jgi:hypothetical protein
MFTFTYSDPFGNAGYGTLNSMDSGLGDGSLFVTSGTLTVTSGAIAGDYTLIPAGPSPSISPEGAFIVDNLIYPSNNAGDGVNPGFSYGFTSGPSYLTVFGLLFGNGAGEEINIWGIGNNDYDFYGYSPSGGYNPAVTGGEFTLSAATPEPAGLTLLGVSLMVLGGYGWRRRKSVAATAT